MKLALVQTYISNAETAANLWRAESLLDELQEADLIVLPEMFHCGFPNANVEAFSVGMDSAVTKWMADTARARNAYVAGGISAAGDGKFYNRLVVVSPEGQMWHYDKRHIFDMGNENAFYSPGQTPRVVVDIAGMRVCFLICYDLRFPVWSRCDGDYDALVYAANWPKARIDVWQTLLKARALENQCYVAGVNRTGIDAQNNVAYNGRSMAYDPKGRQMVMAEDAEQVLTVDWQMEPLRQFREKFNVLEARDSFKIL